MDGNAAVENVVSKLEDLALQDQTGGEGGGSRDNSSRNSSNPAIRPDDRAVGLVDMAGEVVR